MRLKRQQPRTDSGIPIVVVVGSSAHNIDLVMLPTSTAASVMKMKRAVVMKAKRVSKVARGRLAKVLVMRGRKEKTAGGLTRDSLVQNRRGKVVSKRASAHGKRMFRFIEPWTDSVMEARRALHIKGFVATNGKSLLGKALYVKAKALYMSTSRATAASSSAPN